MTKFIFVNWLLYIGQTKFSFTLPVFLASNYFYLLSYLKWTPVSHFLYVSLDNWDGSNMDRSQSTDWCFCTFLFQALFCGDRVLICDPPASVSQILGLQGCAIVPKQLDAASNKCVTKGIFTNVGNQTGSLMFSSLGNICLFIRDMKLVKNTFSS